ncbi:M15 family metallopeptidase [Staphylococcus massiliensis]|uniref:M15 family metallopeptidase n=1 Tax=Staphylococcus massiliensis TaxID=555791 RepID=UPI001EE02AB7|nr:M15 family metallopeptidase [Staphylococcus massiliensis]MCG3400573.1 M15 family metallopeptidase [Staphylococcus massiliensis]MCG3401434.1 M15 family metallopeptidase [Staphylococcus massiliensis]
MRFLTKSLLMGALVMTGCANDTSTNNEEPKDVETSDKAQQPKHRKVVKDGKTYIDGILVANKEIGLPSDFVPGEDPEAQIAINKMIADANREGIQLYKVSGFRSYQTQVQLFNNYKARDGEEAANKYSSKPGHSEHQTGLTYDVGEVGSPHNLYQSFGQTRAGLWVKKHASRYGFIIRYQKGKEDETGYQYEPWHLRYLGQDKARDVKDSGKSLEAYLGLYNEETNERRTAPLS